MHPKYTKMYEAKPPSLQGYRGASWQSLRQDMTALAGPCHVAISELMIIAYYGVS